MSVTEGSPSSYPTTWLHLGIVTETACSFKGMGAPSVLRSSAAVGHALPPPALNDVKPLLLLIGAMAPDAGGDRRCRGRCACGCRDGPPGAVAAADVESARHGACWCCCCPPTVSILSRRKGGGLSESNRSRPRPQRTHTYRCRSQPLHPPMRCRWAAPSRRSGGSPSSSLLLPPLIPASKAKRRSGRSRRRRRRPRPPAAAEACLPVDIIEFGNVRQSVNSNRLGHAAALPIRLAHARHPITVHARHRRRHFNDDARHERRVARRRRSRRGVWSGTEAAGQPPFITFQTRAAPHPPLLSYTRSIPTDRSMSVMPWPGLVELMPAIASGLAAFGGPQLNPNAAPRARPAEIDSTCLPPSGPATRIDSPTGLAPTSVCSKPGPRNTRPFEQQQLPSSTLWPSPLPAPSALAQIYTRARPGGCGRGPAAAVQRPRTLPRRMVPCGEGAGFGGGRVCGCGCVWGGMPPYQISMDAWAGRR